MFKQTYKHLKYLNNKFVNKNTKSKNNALLTLLVYNSILSLLGRKKYSYKREQFTKIFKNKLR